MSANRSSHRTSPSALHRTVPSRTPVVAPRNALINCINRRHHTTRRLDIGAHHNIVTNNFVATIVASKFTVTVQFPITHRLR
jgi:hypothetical protein